MPVMMAFHIMKLTKTEAPTVLPANTGSKLLNTICPTVTSAPSK